jgi:DNA-binding CsgD family transcriptional regulator
MPVIRRKWDKEDAMTELLMDSPVREDYRPAPHATVTPPRATSGPDVLAWVIDAVDIGLMLVARDGRMRMANRAAMRHCDPGRTCRLLEGVVRPALPGDDAAFRRALADAALGRRSLLTLGTRQSLTAIAFVPAARGRDPESPDALLVFGKHEVCAPLSVHFFAREHGVTSAESAVLAALCNGASPRQIASERGIALSTVRTQIQNIRQKTGARNISDLLRLASRLPPLMTIEMCA